MDNKLFLYSNDSIIKEKLKSLKNKEKDYNNLINALKLLGKFDRKVEVELYDVTEKKIIVCCTDLYNNIFLFYIDSEDKKDHTKIIKNTNENDTCYDISLSKKFELNSENIKLIKKDKVISFKNGRLITDGKSFYHLFLGDNITYTIETEKLDNQIDIDNIIEMLNKLEKVPNLIDYVDIFDKVLKTNNISYERILIESYKDFEKTGSFIIEWETIQNSIIKK